MEFNSCKTKETVLFHCGARTFGLESLYFSENELFAWVQDQLHLVVGVHHDLVSSAFDDNYDWSLYFAQKGDLHPCCASVFECGHGFAKLIRMCSILCNWNLRTLS